ncbi:MAG TPA: hypothetical protein VG370_34955 [Chloroflexota bacterium]|nr:hypothetical protein [Chloroflexota bacterium]
MSESPAEGVRFSMRELLTEINRRFDATDAKLDLVLKDFTGFERRFALHEAAPGHPPTQERTTALEHDVEALKTVQLTRDALDAQLRRSAEETASARREVDEQRRWLVGLSLTTTLSLLALLGRAFGLV